MINFHAREKDAHLNASHDSARSGGTFVSTLYEYKTNRGSLAYCVQSVSIEDHTIDPRDDIIPRDAVPVWTYHDGVPSAAGGDTK